MLIRSVLAVASLAACTAPASAAMSPQGAPAPGAPRAAVADPDERLERLADQRRDRSVRETFDRSSARSVMDYGSQASQRQHDNRVFFPR